MACRWLSVLCILALMLVACGTANTGTPGPTVTALPTSEPTSTLTAPSTIEPTPTVVVGNLAFNMNSEYQLGEPIEIAVRNNSDVRYYYQSYYPACYNLEFFDDSSEQRPYPYADPATSERVLSPGQFIVPQGTHCDLISESPLDPGQRAVLFIWGQQICVKDRWGCVESVAVEPGKYQVRGRFSRIAGVIGPGLDQSASAGEETGSITTVQWDFIINPAETETGPDATPTPTPPATVQSRPPASNASRVVDANNRFAFDLLSQLRQQDGDQNLFFSPLSVSMALTMTYNGAAGDAEQSMAETLHLAGMDRDTVNQANAALLAAMAKREPDLELHVANSLWAREGMTFHQAFFDRVSQDYNAEVESLPFDDAARERINGWVSDQTNGKIDPILDQVNPNDVMYLINAIYFKASWWFAFQEKNTKQGTFHNADGSDVEVPMMHQQIGKYDYLDGGGFSALRLRYLGDASMYLFLPDQDSNLTEFLNNLNGDAWAQWMEDFSEGGGDITLPRFEMEYDANLNDPLKALGMGIAFSGDADFSEMGPGDLWIDRVVHKAVVEVHEAGTEAAAATMVAMLASGPAFTFEFNVDRPFFFAITDDQTGSILFMGVVHELRR